MFTFTLIYLMLLNFLYRMNQSQYFPLEMTSTALCSHKHTYMTQVENQPTPTIIILLQKIM